MSTIFAFNAESGAPTKTATFSKITDAVPGKYYEPATTAPHPADANRLAVGLNGFVASSRYPYSRTAMDTISFRVTAPAGFYISTLTYAQAGELRTSRGGGVRWAGNWVVGDFAADHGGGGTAPRVA